MIGTVTGLIQMFAALDDVNKIGPAMAARHADHALRNCARQPSSRGQSRPGSTSFPRRNWRGNAKLWSGCCKSRTPSSHPPRRRSDRICGPFREIRHRARLGAQFSRICACCCLAFSVMLHAQSGHQDASRARHQASIGRGVTPPDYPRIMMSIRKSFSNPERPCCGRRRAANPGAGPSCGNCECQSSRRKHRRRSRGETLRWLGTRSSAGPPQSPARYRPVAYRRIDHHLNPEMAETSGGGQSIAIELSQARPRATPWHGYCLMIS